MAAINKTKESVLSHDRLVELLTYNPETGIFIRNITSGGRKRGAIAGSLDKETGYTKISIDSKSYRAHRLAWFYCFKNWPSDQLDHIDRNRSNNSISNLRETSNRDNQHNIANSSIYGHNIYYIHNKYMVSFKLDKDKTLSYYGLYDTLEKATTIRDIVYTAIKNKLEVPTLKDLKKRVG